MQENHVPTFLSTQWEIFTSNNPLNSWQIYNHKFLSDVDYLYLPTYQKHSILQVEFTFCLLQKHSRKTFFILLNFYVNFLSSLFLFVHFGLSFMYENHCSDES